MLSSNLIIFFFKGSFKSVIISVKLFYFMINLFFKPQLFIDNRMISKTAEIVNDYLLEIL